MAFEGYMDPYLSCGWGGCRWFPWLPRRWWTGMYWPITPWTKSPYGITPTIPKEQEIAMLEEQAKYLEQQLQEIRKRIEELKLPKEERTSK